MKRRHKRLREKISQGITSGESAVEGTVFPSGVSLETSDEFINVAPQDSPEAVLNSLPGIVLSDCVDALGTVRCSHKIRSFSIR